MQEIPVHERYLRILEPLEEPTNWEPVPWDRMLSGKKSFPSTPISSIQEAMRRVHACSEKLWTGDGRYLDGREIRTTSRRVIGYLRALEADEVVEYRERAREGLEYLLREQRENGQWAWYGRSLRGLVDLDDNYYDTGICGVALALGFQAFKDERYRAAGEKAGQWAMNRPLSRNTNYNLFATWHLALLYAETGKKEYLEAAIFRAREGGAPNQLPSGGWPGHNSLIWYHGIILRGMGQLLKVLPERHPFEKELRARLTAGFNRCIREQLEDGEVPPRPGLSGGFHHSAFPLQAALITNGLFPSLSNLINGLLAYNLASSAIMDPERIPTIDPETRRRIANAEATLGTPAFRCDFDAFRIDSDWGEMAEDWFPVWIPGNRPEPMKSRFLRNEIYPRIGRFCQEYRVRGWEGNSGIGTILPKGLLREGQRYRMEVWCQGQETPDASKCLRNFYVSVYSGTPRPNWDCYSGCIHTVEIATRGYYSPLHVDFTAQEANHLHVAFQGITPAREGEMSLLVDSITVMPILEEPSLPPGIPESLDVEMMVLGEALAMGKERSAPFGK